MYKLVIKGLMRLTENKKWIFSIINHYSFYDRESVKGDECIESRWLIKR